jgi:hypothetical protein
MKPYLFYVHVPSALTPHLRVFNVDGRDELAKLITAALREWPDFELIDIYDAENEQPVMQVKASEAPPH